MPSPWLVRELRQQAAEDYRNGHDCHFCGERVPAGKCHRRGYSRTTGWSACEVAPSTPPAKDAQR